MWHCLNKSSKLVKRWNGDGASCRAMNDLGGYSQPAWMVGRRGALEVSQFCFWKGELGILEPTKTILWTWKNHEHRSPEVKLEPFGMLYDMHFGTKLRAVDFCNHLLLAVCRWVWLGPRVVHFYLQTPRCSMWCLPKLNTKTESHPIKSWLLNKAFVCVSGHEKTHVGWGLTCSAKIHQLLQFLQVCLFVAQIYINHHGLDSVNG